MDKYRKVIKPKEEVEKPENEIRLTAQGSVSNYVSRAATVFGELGHKKVVITAAGNALSKAVTLAEVIKRRFKGLHQITSIGSQEIIDEYEPKEEGLDKVTQTRSIPSIMITLSQEDLDKADKGYQAPIDESLVEEIDPEEIGKKRGGGRGGGKGKSKGKGKGRGKGKGKGKEEPKGKGKSKGKGKGKGKEEPEGKGKGKAKGKGKGKDEPKGKGKGKAEKGKGKGKSKSEPKGKSKGKGGKSKGWDSWDDWGYGGSSKGKGKGKAKGKGKGSWGW